MHFNSMKIRNIAVWGSFLLIVIISLSVFALEKLKTEDMRDFQYAQRFAAKAGMELDPSKVKVSQRDDFRGPEKQFTIIDELYISINEETGKLMHLSNTKEREEHRKLVEQGMGDMPTLTETQVINIANKFLTDVAEKDISEYEPEPKFDYKSNVSKGTWRILFHRNYKGFVCQDDWLNVSVSDPLKKVVGFARSALLELPASVEIKVSKKKAIEKAKEVAEEFLIRAGKEDTFYAKRKAGDVKSTKLLIVNPNSIFTPQWWQLQRPLKTKESRLAYVIEIEMIEKENPKAGGYILVWIDTGNGEVLGGDYTF